MCVFSSHSFWTSSSLDVPAGVTQEEGHTGFLIHLLSAVHALIFLARRIQPFLNLVDREVEFCVLLNNDLIVLHPLGIFSFLVRKIPFAGIELTSQHVRGYVNTSELPGRPVPTSYEVWQSFCRDRDSICCKKKKKQLEERKCKEENLSPQPQPQPRQDCESINESIDESMNLHVVREVY